MIISNYAKVLNWSKEPLYRFVMFTPSLYWGAPYKRFNNVIILFSNMLSSVINIDNILSANNDGTCFAKYLHNISASCAY